MSHDRRVAPRLERLNLLDVRDLLGPVLEDQARRNVQRRLLHSLRVQGDTLSGGVRQQRAGALIALTVRLPADHVSCALTLEVDSNSEHLLRYEYVATLLVAWVINRTTFLVSTHPAPPSPRVPLAPDVLWHGLRGPYARLVPLLNLKRVGDLRKLAWHLNVSGSTGSRDEVLAAINSALNQADVVRSLVHACIPFQQALLGVLVIRDTAIPLTHLEKIIHPLPLPEDADLEASLHALAKAGLVFNVPAVASADARGTGDTAWCVPTDLSPLIAMATHDGPAGGAHGRASLLFRLAELRADLSRPPTPAPSELTATTALHGIWIALQSRQVPYNAPVRATLHATLPGLRAWPIDPDDLVRVQAMRSQGGVVRYTPIPDTSLALLPPPLFVSDNDLAVLAVDIGTNPDMLRFLLRTLDTLGLVAPRRGSSPVRLLENTEQVLARPPADLTRLLAATWAWDTSWSEVHDLEGLVVRRRYPLQSPVHNLGDAERGWRPDQIYAELAAIRRCIVRLLRTLEPDCWYTLDGFIALVYAIHPRLLYDQRSVGTDDGTADRWWLSRSAAAHAPEGQRLDPHTPADWQHAEARIIAHMLRGSLTWLGILEPATAASGTALFRITSSGAYLLDLCPAAPVAVQAAPAASAGLQISANLAKQHLTIQLASNAADAATLAHLAAFATPQGLSQGVLTYCTTPQRITDALQQGLKLADIQYFLQTERVCCIFA